MGRRPRATGLLQLALHAVTIVAHSLIVLQALLELALLHLELVLDLHQLAVQVPILLRLFLQVRRPLRADLLDVLVSLIERNHGLIHVRHLLLSPMLVRRPASQLVLQLGVLGSQPVQLLLVLRLSGHQSAVLLLTLGHSSLELLLELTVLMLEVFALFQLSYQRLHLIRDHIHGLTLEEALLGQQRLARSLHTLKLRLQRFQALLALLKLLLELLDLLGQLLVGLGVDSHGSGCA